MKPVSFGTGLNLQSGPYKTDDLGELLNSPIRDIISEELARSDNAVAVYRKYTDRDYVIAGSIEETSSAALEAAIDQLKLKMLDQIDDVIIGWGAGYRYYRSECKNVAITRRATDLTMCRWSAQFYMPKAFATDGTTATFLTALSGFTGRSTQVAVNNGGTYLAFPVVSLTLTNIEPNITPVSITIGNSASSEFLTITETFADGDVITFNLFTKKVFVNSRLVNPTGKFPAWAPGPGLLDYSDTGSSGTISMTGNYEPRYL